ncbi:MAG: YraN family protein [Gammaproteobacteria bacterium]|nr:YraN family protein [Gammaproteobacteria bacterium]
MIKLKPFSSRSTKGKTCENFALNYLTKNGLKLIEKNFNSRYGEIDLIMQHQNAVVFIEVRYRKNEDYGGAKASVTPTKQNKIQKTALYYMQKKGREMNARFDVIAISGEYSNLTIEWIKNAF